MANGEWRMANGDGLTSAVRRQFVGPFCCCPVERLANQGFNIGPESDAGVEREEEWDVEEPQKHSWRLAGEEEGGEHLQRGQSEVEGPDRERKIERAGTNEGNDGEQYTRDQRQSVGVAEGEEGEFELQLQ